MDLSAVAHLAAIKGAVPFINFFDGFRTSHEVQKIAVWDYDDLAEHAPTWTPCAPSARTRSTPSAPPMRGSHENGDIFFQHREACNSVLRRAARGRRGVHAQDQREAGHRLRAVQLLRRAGRRPRHRGDGLVLRRGSRRSSTISTRTARRSAWSRCASTVRSSPRSSSPRCPRRSPRSPCMDRTKEPGALGEPLYMDVVNALVQEGRHGHHSGRRPLRPGLQGHPAGIRVRHLQGAREGRAAPRVHAWASSTT